MGELNRSWALDVLRDYLDVSTRPTRRDRLRRGWPHRLSGAREGRLPDLWPVRGPGCSRRAGSVRSCGSNGAE